MIKRRKLNMKNFFNRGLLKPRERGERKKKLLPLQE
jgi:hypothetical protein